MRIRQLAATVLAAVVSATIAGDAIAFNAWILGTEVKTLAFASSGNMSPYGMSLQREILVEIRRNEMPFRLIAPARVVVLFALNRRGELAHLSSTTKSRSKLIDDYAETMVRKASRRFRALPADHPGDIVAFAIPINLQ